ncbi:hypothetical protein F5887DRAFT_921213 [Amanita rubescens]|nr:hypothetical protein F5887DRAFT_921213 [Amanita rubescens]
MCACLVDDSETVTGYRLPFKGSVGKTVGVWLCGAKNANAIIVNVEDRRSEMTRLAFHHPPTANITNISELVVCPIEPIFDVSIYLFSKITPGAFDQTLLLFVVTLVNSGVPVPLVQPMLIAERMWLQ